MNACREHEHRRDEGLDRKRVRRLPTLNEWYASPPGVKNGVQSALNNVIGETLLFPVFDTGDAAACGGAGLSHRRLVGVRDPEVVNWNNGQGHLLRGYFVEYIAHDVEINPGGGAASASR